MPQIIGCTGWNPPNRNWLIAWQKVFKFGTQNPHRMLCPPVKKSEITLQRINATTSQIYPQNPIISIPMLLTLLFQRQLELPKKGYPARQSRIPLRLW